jgi:hypothetical protein
VQGGLIDEQAGHPAMPPVAYAAARRVAVLVWPLRVNLRTGGEALPGRAFYWAELRSKDFKGLDPEKTIAILPVAAIEQHGPHLPVMTDSAIA